MFAVIVENDVTQWNDENGVSYHYPRRYRRLLQPGTKLLHYKGKLQDRQFRNARLSDQPHYFATSIAGESYVDPNSAKGDLRVEIHHYRAFDVAVLHKKDDGQYRELIPANRANNFWRDGVRICDEVTFLGILAAAGLSQSPSATLVDDQFTSTVIEGNKRKVYTTTYERDPANRQKAIALHGTTCFACELNLGALYGPVADGFVHVHHRRPLHLSGPTPVDPAIDLVPLCPNCHAIVHLGGRLHSVNQVRAMLGKGPIALGD